MMCKVLIFGCIAAVILMTAAYRLPPTTELPPAEQKERLTASIRDLEQLKNIENNFLDFYTPNDKPECNRATLKCWLKELEVLKKDVEEENQRHIINIEKNLDYFKVSNYSNPACKNCAFNEKKLFPEFRQELNSFLQSLLKEIV